MDDRVVLDHGAASGIGLASAQLCAEAGALVMLADLDEASGLAAARAIDPLGGRTAFSQVDAIDEQSVSETIAATVARFGRLQVLVNSAGAQSLESDPGRRWHSDVDLYLKAPFYASRSAVGEIVR